MGLTGPTQKTVETTNRAPYYTDAATQADLLTSNTSKTITVLDAQGNPAIAIEVLIINSSGQVATVNLHHAVSGAGRNPEAGFPVEIMITPMTLLAGESYSVPGRVASVVETNVGAGSQTGYGVRYLFIIQPDE